ncbi:MAG: hypothetical protein FJ276_37355 [Planctomycetes bacterium]|nr:hypothetical protein [Planctomycetota bacterium]
MPNAVVLVLDRLGSGWLGPYGNTRVDTPAWNRLAAQALLAEFALVDTPDLASVYHSYWQGRHALSRQSASGVSFLADRLAAQGVQTWLVTDEPEVTGHAGSDGFLHRTVLPAVDADRQAGCVEDTQCARLFATVLEVLEHARSPFLIWVHAQAMQGPWDAPQALRCQLAEEGDPDPPEFVAPPEVALHADYDPDHLLGIMQAYGAQVAALDVCLGILLDTVWSRPAHEATALLATASRGYPIGEHRYVGRANQPPYAELVQVPWLVHCPDSTMHAVRDRGLVQPPDLFPTLLNWFDVPLPETRIWGADLITEHEGPQRAGEPVVHRDRACAACGDQRHLRTGAWSLLQLTADRVELYTKPDDRWEVNEVSDRCGDVVEELRGVLAEFEEAAQSDDRCRLRDLPPSLVDAAE